MVGRWIAKGRGPLGYLLVVGLVAAAALVAPFWLGNALEQFQPPEMTLDTAQSLLPGGAAAARSPGTTQPLTNRVVLVVVAGLNHDSASSLPALQAEKFVQASARAQLFTASVQPTLPGLTTLLTGASLDLSGGFTIQANDTTDPTPPTDTGQLSRLDSPIACGNLLTCVKHSKNSTAFFGSPEWYGAMQPEWLDYYGPNGTDSDLANSATNYLKRKSANFTLVQLAGAHQAELLYGINSPEALAARLNLNEALTRLVNPAEVELNKTTVIVTGDWDNNTQAGDRWTVPLFMVGQAVQPGDIFWGRQEDVASTVAALLGVEIPRANQGRIMTPALAMPTVDLAEKMLALTEQRRALSLAYRVRLGLSLPIALNDPQAVDAEKSLRVAVQDYRLGSYDNVESVLDPVLRNARQDMAQARQEWFAQERGKRALIAAGLLIVPLLALLIWRSGLALLALFGSSVAVGLPWFFYWSQGRNFAFSSSSPDDLRADSIWRSGLGLLAGLLIIALLFDFVERRGRKLTGRVHLEYVLIAGLRVPRFPFPRLFTCCVLMLGWLVYLDVGLPVAWYFWRFGWIGSKDTPVLPDFSAVFVQFFTLNHLLGFVLWMAFGPLVLAGLFALKRQLLGDGEKIQPDEPDLSKHSSQPETSIVIKA